MTVHVRLGVVTTVQQRYDSACETGGSDSCTVEI